MAKLFEIAPSRTPDADAREQALDVERSWIVEAPAGSGKTGLLIQRYLRLLGHSTVTEPEQVLAITFTKAATEEIRERILRELQRARENVIPKTDYDRTTQDLAKAVLLRDSAHSWRLLDEPRRLRVRTIDAVCAEITRSLPILCGGGSSLVPTEDASSLYHEAARRTWLRLGGRDVALSDALRCLLLHRDGDLHAGIDLVSGMLKERQQWGSLIPLRAEDLSDEALDKHLREQLDQSLEQVVCEGLSRLARAFPALTLRRLASLANNLSDRPGYNNQASPLAVCRELKTSPGDAAEHLMQWHALVHLLITPSKKSWRRNFGSRNIGLEIIPTEAKQLREIALEVQAQPELLALLNEVGSLPPARFPSEQWQLTKALLRVLRQALIELQLVFNQEGRCDFAEPALLARYALEQEDSRHSLGFASGTELRHLLIDEMQDTSTKQYELIERLVEGWADEQKTIFLVGDPKQSIYLFRHARVERFVETMRTGRLGALPVGLLQLTANFRSQAGLVSAFNQDFGKVFPQTITRAEDVNYVQAVATRKLNSRLEGAAGAAWHVDVIAGDNVEMKRNAQAQLLRDARDIRSIVERWRAKPLPDGRSDPWKIAVLVQSRQNLRTILPELRREPSIPFHALKIDTLDTRREILDLLALTRALLHPADRTAWLAVLRAPWCGLDLRDLHVLTGKDNPEFLGSMVTDLVSLFGTEISPDGIERLERVWPVLNTAVHATAKIRLPECVERTWRSLGGNTFLNEAAFRNALTFLDLLRTLDREEGKIRLPTLMHRLKDLYAATESRPDAIDLVTIHRSKGLEWDVVIVPELERTAPRSKAHLFEWEELLNGSVIVAPISAKGEDATALNKWLRGLRSRREASERKRLFYVACTRAREEFHLFGIAKMGRNGTIAPAGGSLLQAAWPAAEDRLATQREALPKLPLRGQAVFDFAANADETVADPKERPNVLERLPLALMPSSLTPNRDAEVSLKSTQPLRLQGPFASRCLGTTVHLFLEEISNRLADGSSAASLLAELAAWESRIRAVLRAHGLPPRTVEQQLRTVAQALSGTLSDGIGLWLLGVRSEARNELALATSHDEIERYRLDRVFRAGPAPQEAGDNYLWLIDYKTATYNGDPNDKDAREMFLDRQRRTYEPQLTRYAKLIGAGEIRLALWFPLMRRLVWWIAGEQRDECDSQDRATQIDSDEEMVVS